MLLFRGNFSVQGQWWRLLLLLALLFSLPGRAAAAGPDLELTVKSAYIYNFVQFIEWPGRRNSGDTEPVKICPVGGGPLANALAELAARQSSARPIQVMPEAADGESLGGCQMVIVGRGAEERLPQLFAKLAGSALLTVSDIPQFARKGGGIGFVLVEGKVKLEINSRAISQAGLKVSAKLLEVARIVE